MVNPEIEELNLLHAHVCSALGDPKRLQILYALAQAPRRVSALAEDLNTPQPTISRHLAILRQRSLVNSDRDGVKVTYSLADPRIIEVLDIMRLVLRDALDRQANSLA
ncbi:MAG: metalloregulator ArsR/SmtB family transcription factor [Chloroflexota bacterium]|jgi:ArsR family transcriptional regulator